MISQSSMFATTSENLLLVIDVDNLIANYCYLLPTTKTDQRKHSLKMGRCRNGYSLKLGTFKKYTSVINWMRTSNDLNLEAS